MLRVGGQINTSVFAGLVLIEQYANAYTMSLSVSSLRI